MNSLQSETIKSIFRNFDHNKQINLICELMEVAKLDSIIQHDRPMRIAGVEMNSPKNETADEKQQRLYREKFDDWLYEFIPQFLVIVEKSYLDRCFYFFDLITIKAKGLCGCPNDGFGYCARDDINRLTPFNPEQPRIVLAADIFDADDIDDSHICSRVKSTDNDHYIKWRISFHDFFVLIYNRGDDDIYALLSIMGFFDDDEEMVKRAAESLKLHFKDAYDSCGSINNEIVLRIFSGLTLTIL